MMRWKNHAIIIISALVVYGNTLGNGFVWDDLLFINDKSPIQHIENIPYFFMTNIAGGTKLPHATPYYRPLHSTMTAIQYHLWEKSPAGYHCVNLMLHIGIALLIFALGQALSLSETASLCASLLYTVHPVHSEAVAYLGGSSELQYTLCYLSAAWFYLRYRESLKAPHLFAAIFCYFFALFTKESAITLPLLLLAIEAALPSGILVLKFARLSAFAAVTALYLLDRFQFVKEISWQDIPLTDRIYTSFGIIMRYLVNLLAPFNLKVLYDLPTKLSFFRSDVMFPLLLLTAAFLLLAWSFRKSGRAFVCGSLLFIGMLPASGLPTILLPAPMADRYLTLPLTGFALLAGVLFDALRPGPAVVDSRRAVTVAVLFSSILLFFGGLTVQRNLLWRDHETLVKRMIRDAPHHFLGYRLLGEIQGKRGDHDAMARNHFMSEQITQSRWLEMGTEFLHLSRIDEAQSVFEFLLREFPPDHRALNGLGLTLLAKGKALEAAGYLRAARSLCPSCDEIAANLRKAESVAPATRN
jgi:hypothetical protein